MKKESVFKRLMGYAGKHKVLTYLSLVLSAISGVLAMMPFVYVYFIIRDVIQNAADYSKATNIVFYGWMAVMFAILAIVIYVGALMCSHIAAFRIAGNMRIKAMEHLTKIPVGEIEEQGSGKLRKIVLDSSSATETYLAHQLPDMSQAMLMPIVILVILFVFDYRLGLVSLLPVVLAFICMFKMIGPKMKDDMAKYQNAMESMNNEAVEYVRGIPIVKTFNQSIYTFKRFKNSIDNYSNFCISYTKKCRGPMIAFEICVNSIFAFLIAIALIMQGVSAVDDVFILNLIFYIVFTPIISTTMIRVMFMSENTMIVEDALSRVDSILSIEPLKEASNPKEPVSDEIIFEDVSFKYKGKDRYALDKVNFVAKENSITALVGPSGGGKSTIASLINRFYDVERGSIKIGGVDVKDISKVRLMKEISYVFQDSRLLKTSILDNVKMGKEDATLEEVNEALRLAQCEDIIKKLPDGINTVIGSKGTYLSGGEMQRISLARAILKDSKIIILDEATAFADPENEALIQKAFQSLSNNKTVIMIAHRLSTVKNADNILVVNDGHIEEEGTHIELVNKDGIYKKMWNDYQKSVKWRVKNA